MTVLLSELCSCVLYVLVATMIFVVTLGIFERK